MPIYCYEADNGEVVERLFRIGHAPRRIELSDGRCAKRSLALEIAHMGTPPKKGWPITCVASGVHPDQAGELRDHLAKAGVPTVVTPGGDPEYRNAIHRRKALKARGIVDRASFC